jgi:hypothetical protein
MNDKQVQLWHRRASLANRIQVLVVLLLQFLLPLYNYISYNTSGIIWDAGTMYLYYQVSSSGVAVNLWTLFLAGFAVYFFLTHREDRVFELLPLSLLPLLVPLATFLLSGGLWIWGTSVGFPSMTLTALPGYPLLAISVFASLLFTVVSLLLEGRALVTPAVPRVAIPERNIRSAVILFLVSVLPIAATAPSDVGVDPAMGLLSLLLTPSENYFYVSFLGIPVGYFNTLLGNLVFEVVGLVAAAVALQPLRNKRAANFALGSLFMIVVGLVLLPISQHPGYGLVAPIWLLILAVCPWLLLPYYLVLLAGRNNGTILEGWLGCFLVITISAIVFYASSVLGIAPIFGPANYRPTLTLLVIPVLAGRLWSSQGSSKRQAQTSE